MFTRHQRQLRRDQYQLRSVPKSTACTLLPPTHRGLVISGGGGRGIAYAGMIQVLERRKFLDAITHISAASAGAIVGSVLALGMNSKEVTTLIRDLNLMKLMDTSHSVRAKGERFRNALEVIYMLQIEKYLALATKPINQQTQLLIDKLKRYRNALQAQQLNINSLEDLIALTDSADDLKKLDIAFSTIPKTTKPNERITFGDLMTLQLALPEKLRRIIKKIVVTVTNQTKDTLEIYSEGTPDHSLADIVQLSGAHPLLFSPRAMDGGTDIMADGGILNNMPSQPLVNAGISVEQLLCVYTQENKSFSSRVKMAKTHDIENLGITGHFSNITLGTMFGKNMGTSDVETKNNEKLFFSLDNMLYLDSGTVTVTSLSPSDQQKDYAIDNAVKQTEMHLAGYEKQFNHALIAMLYLGRDNLSRLLENSDDHQFMISACQAKALVDLQEHLIVALNKGKPNIQCILDYLKSIENTVKIDPNLSPGLEQTAFLLCINQVNYMTEGKLIKVLQQNKKTDLEYINKILKLASNTIEVFLKQHTSVESEQKPPILGPSTPSDNNSKK